MTLPPVFVAGGTGFVKVPQVRRAALV